MFKLNPKVDVTLEYSNNEISFSITVVPMGIMGAIKDMFQNVAEEVTGFNINIIDTIVDNIKDWTGVCDDNENPLELTKENKEVFLESVFISAPEFFGEIVEAVMPKVKKNDITVEK